MTPDTNPLEHLSNADLIRRVHDLEAELHMARIFAAVPETDTADAALQWRGRNRFLAERVNPVRLEPIVEESLDPLLGEHKIIDGDNLAVMHSLLSDHRGGPQRGFDVIYLDPPYNTGDDVFAYNDDYHYSPRKVKAIRRRYGRAEHAVSLDDPTRHTKWINHIAPRLWVAKKLLKDTGVIIISIDEHELPRLWLLMEEMFDEKNRIATLIWERSRKNDTNYVSEGHEYILVWARNKKALDAKRGQMALTAAWERVKGGWRKRKAGADAILTVYAEAKALYGDDIPRIQQALDDFFDDLDLDHPAHDSRYKKVDKRGVYNDDGNLNWPGGGGPRYDVRHPVTGQPVKVPASGWRYPDPEDMQKLIDNHRINFKNHHSKIPRLITYLHEIDLEVQTSMIARSGQRAVEVVEAVLGKGVFKNPKDHELLAELFNLVTWRDPNAVIFDPYAGSGTTGHAVLDMNAEDGGNRRFILIENGYPSVKAKVARDRYTTTITAERIRRVMTGQWADGKPHPTHQTGFTFYRAHEEITRAAIMSATRESLADIILQVIEEDSNRIDCRVDGYTYVIGRTRLGYGIALVWDATREKRDQVLTWPILEAALDEATSAALSRPIHIYATGNVAAISDDLYRFHQIPDSILVRLNILTTEREVDE